MQVWLLPAIFQPKFEPYLGASPADFRCNRRDKGEAQGAISSDMLDEYFRQYALIAIFVLVATVIPLGMLLGGWALSIFKVRPYAPDSVKKAIYECGFETLTGRWSQFNFRFYAFALIFVVFDVEVVFLFPWAASFGLLSAQFGLFVLFEMVVFVAILVVGWLYAWRKGALEWS